MDVLATLASYRNVLSLMERLDKDAARDPLAPMFEAIAVLRTGILAQLRRMDAMGRV